MIVEYILKFHLQDCIHILSEQDIFGYYSIKIDFLKLFETYPDVGDSVLCSPIKSLPACNAAIIKAQKTILDQHNYRTTLLKLNYYHLKQNVYARFFGLPVCPELHRTVFPKNVDLGCFMKVTGTVVRVTQSKMLEYQRKYVCTKCRYENLIQAKFDHRYVLKAPSKCCNEEIRCRSSTFTQVNLVSREHCKDYQEIKIQELVNKLTIGTLPGSVWVVLEDDLVDCCKPGDDVNICGTVRRRWRPTAHSKKCEVELVLQANYIEVCNTQRSEVIASAPDVKECFNMFWENYDACPLKGRDQILASVCPQVYGLHLVKLALLLTVITGSNHIAESESDKKISPDDHITRVRGQCHLLLVGDPGTGKSQLLRAGAELTSRSVFTSGAGSTRAGLTCAALREEGEWQLEAGALVLSDGGVCCIDEISQLREHDRTAIHEAMEQQTISVAKAGIVCKLNTRCAIIAACNPKGHYQVDMPLSVNVSLGTPLLSRFDLIFILLDSKNKAWDKLVSSYILFGESNSKDAKKQWSIEKLQMYIGLVGSRQTQMTKSANTILQLYYMTQRRAEHRDPSRTTVRMLDSLVRLSQAHCRLMYRTTILPVDAITAISLIDLSMQDCTLNDTVDALHSTFQKHPDFEYLRTAKKLLGQLNLSDIWQEELLRYAKLLQVDSKTLDCDIENNSRHLFEKYDDVADDNIPLSASLITSSYFNCMKSNNDNAKIINLEFIDDKNNFDKENSRDVNKKLAETLKKHAELNKSERKPPRNCKNNQSLKRKRKAVVLNSSSITTKVKKSKPEKIKTENVDDLNSEEIIPDAFTMLNAVPSVNDVFSELGIDFKCINTENETADFKLNTVQKQQAKVKNGNYSNNDSNQEDDTSKENKHENDTMVPSKSLSKLMQFRFIEKHDKSKFYEEKSKDQLQTPNDTKAETLKKAATHDLIKQMSVSSSQISIFESSDCDIDLDI